MTDPMTGYEAAEADAVDRQDEARREQHWREAEKVVSDALAVRRVIAPRLGDLPYALDLIDAVRWGVPEAWADGITSDTIRILQAFEADYGTPALLRVIATAMENSK